MDQSSVQKSLYKFKAYCRVVPFSDYDYKRIIFKICSFVTVHGPFTSNFVSEETKKFYDLESFYVFLNLRILIFFSKTLGNAP